MSTSYLIGKNESVIRLLQITDSHLFAKEEDTLVGVNSSQSFAAVLDQIRQTSFDYEAVLTTGDLIQDRNPDAYKRFAKMVKQLSKPVFWLEGNHDQQPEMSLYLSKYPYIRPEKQILAGKKWQILLLNSQMAGVSKGYLSRGQFAWLDDKLAEHADRHALIALHHNILPTNSAWLDQHRLINVTEFAQILQRHSNVKVILHGHIHQEVDTDWSGYRVLATPSTCIQFKPNCDKFTLDLIPPGWRELCLFEDGSIETEVKHLTTNSFFPDNQSTGY